MFCQYETNSHTPLFEISFPFSLQKKICHIICRKDFVSFTNWEKDDKFFLLLLGMYISSYRKLVISERLFVPFWYFCESPSWLCFKHFVSCINWIENCTEAFLLYMFFKIRVFQMIVDKQIVYFLSWIIFLQIFLDSRDIILEPYFSLTIYIYRYIYIYSISTDHIYNIMKNYFCATSFYWTNWWSKTILR